MIRLIFVILIIIMLNIFWKNSNNNNSNKIEYFYDTMRPYRHARLNLHNGLDWVDDLPPCAKGEKSCGVVPCPSVFQNDIVCWKCWEQEVEPQNMLGHGHD